MHAPRTWAALTVAAVVALCAAPAGASGLSPCTGARVRCRAGERFLEVAFELQLSNPTARAIDAPLLRGLDTLQSAEAAGDDLVLTRRGDSLHASVPPGFTGSATILVRQRIRRKGAASESTLPLPLAASSDVEVDLPGRRVELLASPEEIGRAHV